MAGIYLHIPFCIHKCFYCDFYSIGKRGVSDEFIRAVCREIELRSNNKEWNGFVFDTVYFGGGTPSLMTPEQTAEIMSSLGNNLDISSNAEITIECNPGTAELLYLREYRTLGFNRLSMGVQSFNPEELQFLERIHSAEEAITAYNKAKEAGFDNLSLDFIFGIPGQTLESFSNTLEQALALEPKHLSVYNLTYEKGTPLFNAQKKGLVRKADELLEEEMFLFAHNLLTRAGYEHYEISNYAKPGCRSRHNSNYWNHTGYIAFGPSAHGFTGKERYWNISNLKKYIQLCSSDILPVEGRETISETDRFHEIILLGLRSLDLDLNLISNMLNGNMKDLKNYLNILQSKDLLNISGDVVRLSPQGMLLSNEIAAKIAGYYNENPQKS